VGHRPQLATVPPCHRLDAAGITSSATRAWARAVPSTGSGRASPGSRPPPRAPRRGAGAT
jgi:hypothetical protein